MPDELWFAAQRVAKDRGESVNAAIVRMLQAYVDQHPEPS